MLMTNLLNEGKRVKNLNLVYTAINTTKSNSVVRMLEKRCREAGINLIVVNPEKCSLRKTDNGFALFTGSETLNVSPKNTIIMPRHPVLNTSESRNFQQTLEFYKFFTINSLNSIDACEDKYTTDRILRNNGISSPKGVVVNVDDLSDLESKIDTLGGQFPIIGKTLRGSLGIGVFICDSLMSLKSVLQMLSRIKPGQEIMLQQKIESDYDLRIHVFNKNYSLNCRGNYEDYEIIGIMRRNKIDNDFRSNFSLGATVERCDITDEQRDMAIKAARAVGCRWCGVDIITDRITGENFIIEVNASPGLKGIESLYNEGGSPLDYIFDFMKKFIAVTPEVSVVGVEESAEISLGDNKNMQTVVGFDVNREFSFIKVQSSDLHYDENNCQVSFRIGPYVVAGKPESTALYGGERSYLFSGSVRFNNTLYTHITFMVCADDEKQGVVLGNNFLSRLGDKVMIDVSSSFLVTDDIRENPGF